MRASQFVFGRSLRDGPVVAAHTPHTVS